MTACVGQTLRRFTATVASACGHLSSSTIAPTKRVPYSSRATSIGRRFSLRASSGSTPVASLRHFRKLRPNSSSKGLKAAKEAGAIVSFDTNYRGKLWSSVGGDKVAVKTFRRIVENVDFLIGNEEDLQKGLGIKGPDVTHEEGSKLDPSHFLEMIDSTVKGVPEHPWWCGYNSA